MTSKAAANCEYLRDAFEGREAIYIEKGVLRVRVTNIRYDVVSQWVAADVEEVFTPGLAGGMYYGRGPGPLRWGIGAGSLAAFAKHAWFMGYGGWSLFFAPEVVNGLVNLAAGWPAELEGHERYARALRYLWARGRNIAEREAYTGVERVFPD